MLLKDNVVPYFRRAVALQSPEVTTDEAYVFTDDELWDILLMCIWEHNPSYDEFSFPQNELPFLVLLGRKELYYRLATASAPFYPLSAEGAELRKDYRFEHYMSLIRTITKEYDSLLSRYKSTMGVEHGVLLKNKCHLKHLQYGNLTSPKFNVTSEIKGDSLILRWTKFDCIGDSFWAYKVYMSNTELDEFTNLEELEPLINATNIHSTAHKLQGLPKQVCHFLIVHESRSGLLGSKSLVVDMRGELDDESSRN